MQLWRLKRLNVGVKRIYVSICINTDVGHLCEMSFKSGPNGQIDLIMSSVRIIIYILMKKKRVLF